MVGHAVELVGIKKRYASTVVLDAVTVRCQAGRVHALVGENGAGKSTLLKILSGVERADAGRLTVLGRDGQDGRDVDLRHLTPHGAQRLGISVVHQEFALVPGMTVAENVFLGREPRRGGLLRSGAIRDRTAELLESLGSRTSPDARIESLSVADAQVVEIVKALSLQPKVIALDEPSAVLAGPELETLYGVVDRLRASGVAVLYVTHRMDELFRVCDDYTVLKDGKVSGAGRISDTSRDEIVRCMVGRDVSSVFPPRDYRPGPPRFEAKDLRVAGLQPIDITVHAGEIVGIAGLGGSGRTRIAKALFGAHPAVGQVFMDGRQVGPFPSPRSAIRAGVAYVPEDRKLAGLALGKSVTSNLTLLALDGLRSGLLLSRRREQREARRLIARFQIKATAAGTEPVGLLSGGNQQKVVFAKWLQREPTFVILDEPTRGIDVGSKEQIYSLIHELAARGVSFLIISSELIEVIGLSDRILVVAEGAVVGEFPGDCTEEDVMHCITATSRLAVEQL